MPTTTIRILAMDTVLKIREEGLYLAIGNGFPLHFDPSRRALEGANP